MQRRFLVTFATEEFAAARDTLVSSAWRSKQFSDVFVWDEHQLHADGHFRNSELLANRRGIGFWSWKPHIILSALERAGDGDIVVYSDAGRYRAGYTVQRDITPLVAFCNAHDGMLPGVLVPNFGPSSRWTKRDCFVLMDCDHARYWNHPQIQATFSVWIKSDGAIRLLSEWSDYCSDIRVIGDMPNTCGRSNLRGFVDHRHDQSILTNLVVKRGIAPYTIDSSLFGWLTAVRPHSLAASLVSKNIDNVASIAGGKHPVSVLARQVLGRFKQSHARQPEPAA